MATGALGLPEPMRHGVEAGCAKRMTLSKPDKTKTDSDEDAVALDGFGHVIAAGGKEPTRASKQR